VSDGRYSMPHKRADSEMRDEQIGQLMAAVARMEKGRNDDQRTLQDIDLRTKDYPQLSQKLRDFIAVGAWFKPFAVVAVMGTIGFVLNQVEQRSEVKQLKSQVSALSSEGDLLKSKLDTLDTNVRSLMAASDRLEKVADECAAQSKRAADGIKERRKR
jgi:hypothetical protein